MHVVVVESPAKARTINRYLGSDYTVLASYGHVRDLPSKDGSVKPDDDFSMAWEVPGQSAKRLNDIAAAMKGADTLILATDPDREGEAISWHVLEVLQNKKAIKGAAVQRVVFNAITKSSILEAMKHPRDIDMELVDAYLARRALDYLVGFTLSPVLWRKLPGSRSAGRVQSVALRLVVEREMEIERFRSQEYWTVEADVTAGGDPFVARLVKHDGKRLQKFDLPNEAAANSANSSAINSIRSRLVSSIGTVGESLTTTPNARLNSRTISIVVFIGVSITPPAPGSRRRILWRCPMIGRAPSRTPARTARAWRGRRREPAIPRFCQPADPADSLFCQPRSAQAHLRTRCGC